LDQACGENAHIGHGQIQSLGAGRRDDVRGIAHQEAISE
jgi:hypothetical protein